MSVMLEHQIVPQSPCTPDCPDRSGDCMLHCSHGYAEYRAARDKKRPSGLSCRCAGAPFRSAWTTKCRT